jgi:hypothetical protein
MSEPRFKLVKDFWTNEETSVVRTWDDGRIESMSVTAEKYKKWLAEGNTPLPADD